MDLGQCFHYETCMEMINKVAHAIDGIKPGAVWILILQNEIQVSFCDPPVVFLAKKLRGAGQQEGAVSGGVKDSSFIKRSVGTTARRFRGPEIFDIGCDVARNRLKNLRVLVTQIQRTEIRGQRTDVRRQNFGDLKECFI